MKSAVLNVSIDTNTPEGERLRDMILSNDFKDGWLVVSWIDRTKYNPVELLKQSEEARRMAVDEAIRLNGECMKMNEWIKNVIDKFEYYEIGTPEEVSLLIFCRFAVELNKLINEAPI